MSFSGILPLIFMLFVLAVVVVAYIVYARDNDGKNETTSDETWLNENHDVLNAPKPQRKPLVFPDIDDDWKDLASAEAQFTDRKPEPQHQQINNVQVQNDIFVDDEDDADVLGTTTVIRVQKAEETADDDDNERTIILKNAAAQAEKDLPEYDHNMPDAPEKPIAFGYRMCWLAFPDAHPNKVLKALDLQDAVSRGWTHGLNAAYEDKGKVFVTPYIDGHTLVIGRALWHKLDLDSDIDDNEWIKGLSKMLGEVKYFSTTSDLNNHAWASLHNGRVVRAYGYSGELDEVVWNYGHVTKEEQGLDFCFVGYPNCRDGVLPCQDNVVELARDWSVDTTFAYGHYQADLGYVGSLKF